MEEHTDECWGVTKMETMQLSYQWTISNFSFCNKRTTESINSPIFSSATCKQYKWHTTLYPNGISRKHKGHLSYYINLSAGRPNIKTHIKFSIINSSGHEVNVHETHYHFTSSESCGIEKFIKIRDVFDKTNEILNDDKLTLCCFITADIESENFSNGNSVKSTPMNLNRLFKK